MNFSVFVPKSRQIGKVVVGLIPAPAMYKSLSFGTHLKKKKDGIARTSFLQFSNGYGKSIGTKVT